MRMGGTATGPILVNNQKTSKKEMLLEESQRFLRKGKMEIKNLLSLEDFELLSL